MPLEIVQVDAFTTEPFRGNPAAVCLLERPADAAWMQRVGREMNLSETAFLVPRGDGDGFDLRWFTPTVEVDLCGHATLAAAHVLWQGGHVASDETIRFHTRSGRLRATPAGDAICLDFPAEPPTEDVAPKGLLDALAVRAKWVGRNRFDVLIELGDEAAVRRLDPDIARLRSIPDLRGVIATAAAQGRAYDFVSRFFAPAAGVDEDPVTGSAHCCLGPYWARRLGKDEVIGYQASARGGEVRVRPRGARVELIGHAVTVLRGELLTPPPRSGAG